jgi:hypothetical protein
MKDIISPNIDLTPTQTELFFYPNEKVAPKTEGTLCIPSRARNGPDKEAEISKVIPGGV